MGFQLGRRSIRSYLVILLCLLPIRTYAGKLRSWRKSGSLMIGTPPTARTGHGMAEALGSIFVFGGTIGSGVLLNDLHQYDVRAMAWVDLTLGQPGSRASPSARSNMGFVAGGGGLVVFGGKNDQGLLNDLHRFDLMTLQWVQPHSVHGAPPSPRFSHGVTVVRAAVGTGHEDVMYVFGGHGESSLYNDLYSFDLVTLAWAQIFFSAAGDAPPAPRFEHGFAAAGGRLYVFGGSIDFYLATTFPTEMMNDLFDFDLETHRWRQLSSGTGPADVLKFVANPRALPSFVGNGRLPAVVGARAAGPAEAALGELPPPMMSAGFVTLGRRIYLFGGQSLYEKGTGRVPRADVDFLYSLDLDSLQWTNLTKTSPGQAPTARHSMGFVAAMGRLYVFGGVGSLTDYYNDLHTFDPGPREWTLIAPNLLHGAPPSPRSLPAMVSLNSSFYMYGGDIFNRSYVSTYDFFRFDSELLRWRTLGVGGGGDVGTPQMSSDYCAMAATHLAVYVFGYDDSGLPEMWRFDPFHESWAVIVPGPNATSEESTPRERYLFRIASLRASDSDWIIYLFGGYVTGYDGFTSNHLYTFNLSSNVWTLVTPAGHVMPTPRYDHGFTASGGRLYTFGGLLNPAVFLDDLYMFDPSTLEWTLLGSDVVSGTTPLARGALGLVSTYNRLIVFGGLQGFFHRVRMEDMYQFDTNTLEWTQIDSASVLGIWPRARSWMGMAIVNEALYIFGGEVNDGALGDMVRLDVARDVTWDSTMLGVRLIDTYDWDRLTIPAAAGTVVAVLGFRLELCIGLFPCALALYADAEHDGRGALLRLGGNGSIVCLFSEGCTGVVADGIQFLCGGGGGNNSAAGFSAVEVAGARLRMRGCTFDKCAAVTDGGSVRSYDGADVQISDTRFIQSTSARRGGAISSFGSILRVSRTNFINCSAAGGGGAVAAEDFVCYGNLQTVITDVEISDSAFHHCTAVGPGGAVLASSKSAQVTLKTSSFTTCATAAAGGAVSAGDGARVRVENCTFQDNSAGGYGGGALHAEDALLEIHGAACTGNTAAAGGGGALYWQGNVSPVVTPWCGPGYYPDPSFTCAAATACTGLCLPCAAGTYLSGHGAKGLSECLSCAAGTYGSSAAAIECVLCTAGTYSSAIGAGLECSVCTAGAYATGAGTTECVFCNAGTYVSAIAATACVECPAPRYSTEIGATTLETCIECAAGSFAPVAGSSACTKCVGGQFWTAGATACTDCAAGSYSTTAVDECVACDVGKYSWVAATTCELCDVGTYSSIAGAMGCDECPAGTTANPGATECLAMSLFRVGQTVSLPDQESDETALILLPFSFPFYCRHFDEANASGNGFLAFGSGVPIPGDLPQHLPNSQYGDINIIAPFWSTLLLLPNSVFLTATTGGSSDGEESAEAVTLQWTDYISKSSTLGIGFVTFQVVLHRNGTIVLAYPALVGASAHGDSAVVGMQSGRDAGFTLINNVPNLTSGECIRINPAMGDCAEYTVTQFDCDQLMRLLPSCLPGWYLNQQMDCAPCGDGSYQTGTGMLSPEDCIQCEPGKFSSESAATDPAVCVDMIEPHLGDPSRRWRDDEPQSALDVNRLREPSLGLQASGGVGPKLESSRRVVPPRGLTRQHKSDIIDSELGDPKLSHVTPSRNLPLRFGRPDPEPGFDGPPSAVLEASVPPHNSTAWPRDLRSLRQGDPNAVADRRVRATDRGSNRGSNVRADGAAASSVAVAAAAGEGVAALYELCGGGNWAQFGGCIASSGKALELSLSTSPAQPAQPGLSFTVKIRKVDAYNQTVASDSKSVLQLLVGEPSATINGEVLMLLAAGGAQATVQMTPSFTTVDPALGTALPVGPVHIFALGLDSELSGAELLSPRTRIYLAANHSVCPSGYVLTIAADGHGTCSLCRAGTYSVDPLRGAGSAASSGPPACLACPVAGVCRGGAAVTFQTGGWTIAGGVYRLVSCPVGHELVNSITGAGGEFAQEAQRCEPCSATGYVLNPNNSLVGCQPCPVGARCDGNTLSGLIPGSVWTPNLATGQYRLTSCPPGYELINALSAGGDFVYAAQRCGLCPAQYYCAGGATLRWPCPDGTFAAAGSNSSESCEISVFVRLVVALPMSASEFTSDSELKFRQAVAYSCGTRLSQVVVSATAVGAGTRASAAGVRVNTQIATADRAAAEVLSADVSESRLNTQLVNQGLPAGQIVSVTVQASPLSTAATVSSVAASSLWVAVGVAVGASLVFALAVVGAGIYMRQRMDSEEERQLKEAMASLRMRLRMTQRDGYILSTESAALATLWRIGHHRGCSASSWANQFTTVKISYLEAAARLELMNDFDLNQFDALCLCLECGDAGGGPGPAYNALCDWMLNVTRRLIRPDLPRVRASGDAGSGGRTADSDLGPCLLRVEERFPYFLRLVSRARVWNDSNGELFERLKAAAAGYMDEIAQLCDDRYEELCKEEGGAALVQYFASPDDAARLTGIRRQDHAEVRAIVVSEEAREERRVISATQNSHARRGVDTPGEEVFIAQLYRRATLLNDEYQAKIISVISQYATPGFVSADSEPTVGSETDMTPHAYTSTSPADSDPHPPVAQLTFGMKPLVRGEQSQGSSSFIRLPSAAPARLPSVGQSKSAGSILSFLSNPAGRLGRQPSFLGRQPGLLGRRPFELSPPSLLSVGGGKGGTTTHSHRMAEVECIFPSGSSGAVQVSGAPAKGVARMREKLAEYADDGADWPLAACILDPVRASIVCTSPAQMLEVAALFVGNHAFPGVGPVRGAMPVCRVKNKFALSKDALVGGYRDLMICAVFESGNGSKGHRAIGSPSLRIIGEIQIHDKTLHDLKMLMHKLYRIQRAKAASVI